MALIRSRVGPVAMASQRGVKATDEAGSCKRLGQEAKCSGLKCPGTDALIRESRDENERRVVPPSSHIGQ